MNNTEDEPTGGEFPSKVTYWIEGVGNLAVGSVGLIINIVALWILFRKQVKAPFVNKIPFQTRQSLIGFLKEIKLFLARTNFAFIKV